MGGDSFVFRGAAFTSLGEPSAPTAKTAPSESPVFESRFPHSSFQKAWRQS